MIFYRFGEIPKNEKSDIWKEETGTDGEPLIKNVKILEKL